jgi:hypothetical protein
MITPEIISYIKAERAKNTPDPVIRSNLLANGWLDSNISEAMSSASALGVPGVPKPLVSSADAKAHRRKVTKNTFITLLGIDILIIVAFKILYGTWGVYGISPTSAVVRVLVIYLIASFSAQGTSVQDSTPNAIGKRILKVFGTLLIVLLVGAGILFATCLFMFGN